MVTFSAVTGYFLTGKRPDESFFVLFIGLFLISAGASVLNQVQERRQDALMPRTHHRPIPAGKISPVKAAIIALVFIGSGALMLSLNGWIPVFLGLLNIVFYNLVYTPLKTRSWLAILPGAVVGGVPPLIGWTSAGSYLFHPNAVFLFIFVCLWQVPHFWLLMIKYGKEYENAGFSSISAVLNEQQIKVVVFLWGVLTSVYLMFFPLFGFELKPVLLGSLVVTNLYFIRFFYRFLFKDKNPQTIRSAFILINGYALAVFILLILNVLVS
jgi:protoheme IX farnesyltransferase